MQSGPYGGQAFSSQTGSRAAARSSIHGIGKGRSKIHLSDASGHSGANINQPSCISIETLQRGHKADQKKMLE